MPLYPYPCIYNYYVVRHNLPLKEYLSIEQHLTGLNLHPMCIVQWSLLNINSDEIIPWQTTTVIRTKSKNVINDNCVSNRDGLQNTGKLIFIFAAF